MMLLVRAMLVLALGLFAMPVHGQHAKECPNPEGLQLSEKELREKLRAHRAWLDDIGYGDPAVPGKAVLCNANLWNVNLEGAQLAFANLSGADLLEANLKGANLTGAKLEGAHLVHANLEGAKLGLANLKDAVLTAANLMGAQLVGARLSGANLQSVILRGRQPDRCQRTNALLSDADLSHAVYAPVSLPPDASHVEGIQGLSSVVIPTDGNLTGLVQLRKLLMEAGLPAEREATYAIERNKTHHLLFRQIQAGPAHFFRGRRFVELDGSEEVRWDEPIKLAEGIFRLLAFELPVAYGLHPARALWTLGCV